jgi:hypothetical protein
MRIDSVGNVGIGATSPTSQLHVSFAPSASFPALGSGVAALAIGPAGNYGMLIGTRSDGAGYIQQQRFDTTTTVYQLVLQPNGGNVGIGTATPSTRLGVAGDGRFTNTANTALNVGGGTGQAQVVVEGPSGTTNLSILHNGSGAYVTQSGGTSGFLFRNTAGDYTFSTGAGNTERMRIGSNGWIGIGRTAQGIFDVHAGGNGTVSYFYAGGSIVYSDIDTHVFRRAAGAESMRIDSSGNLLVNTTTASGLGTQSKFKTNGTSGAAASIGSVSNNTTGAIDTLIPINQSNFGGTALLLASRNTGSGTATDSAVYLVRFYYDGNNAPTKTLIAGTDFVTFGVSGSQTLTLTNSSGGNVSYAWFGNK